MLQNISIQNFILIEKLDLDFEPGFCVITGQTGAGKSILLDAILFALGGKFGNEIIRTDQQQASVVLTFKTSDQINKYLDNSAIESSLDEIIIKRVQAANGRKKFFVNDQLVSQKIVANLFDYLLELQGQHNHTSLLNVASHFAILDQFSGNDELRLEVLNLYKSWQAVKKELEKTNLEKKQIIEEIEYLTHICQEFEDLNIQENEEEELSIIKKQLQTREKEIKLINDIVQNIDNSNIGSIIAKSQRNISKSENIELYNEVHKYFDEIYDKIEDSKTILNQILYDFDFPEHNLANVEDRLYAIRSIARKHGVTIFELEKFIANSKNKLTQLQAKLHNVDNLNNKLDQLKTEYMKHAKILSDQRAEAAKELEFKVMEELKMVDMKKAMFITEVISSEDFASANGIDQVRFIASTNPGMPKAPIDKIASGGELSRFMLALRAALFDKYIKPVIIFDEIDVGISGSVADSIGQRLKLLSKVAQVIVITHQPQVAGKADQHILVQKTQHDKTTSVDVMSLNLEARSSEVARMISGKKITDQSLAAAKELIDL